MPQPALSRCLDDELADLRSQGFALVARFTPPGLLVELQVEADRLVGRFTEQGFRSSDFWTFTPAATGIPVLYRIHNLQDQGEPELARLFSEGPRYICWPPLSWESRFALRRAR